MLLSAAIGAGRNPCFRGGRYRLPGFCSIGNLEADCKETKTRKQKSLRNVVVFHPPAFLCSTPPLSLLQKACGLLEHEKRPKSANSNRLRKSRGGERRIVVNRAAN